MTAPPTIRATRTATPPGVPALVDAEILAVNLVWTLQQLKEHAGLDGVELMTLLVALDAATECQYRIMSLQITEERRA